VIPPLCARCGGRTDGKVSAPSMAVFGALISCECPTADQVRANVARNDAEREARAAAGLCRNCGRPALLWSRETLAAGVCTYGKGSYSCGKPLFDDCEDRRLPARDCPGAGAVGGCGPNDAPKPTRTERRTR
jgi:hypothetical protein